MASQAIAERPSFKVFVGQLPKTMPQSEVKEIFNEFGGVEEVVLITDKQTKESKGCCFVKFSKRESADACIAALNDKRTIAPSPKPLRVKYADGETDVKLFIGQLPKSVDEPKLRELMGKYGTVREALILKSKQGGSKGAGFVKMETRADAINVINALHGYVFPDHIESNDDGHSAARPLNIKFADTERDKLKKEQQQQQLQDFQMQQLQFQLPAAMSMMAPSLWNPHPGLKQSPLRLGQSSRLPPGLNKSAMSSGSAATLFVYHLPADWTQAELFGTFAEFGNVTSAAIMTDPTTGQSKGFGTVTFDINEAAEMAVASINGVQIGNSRLKVVMKKASSTPYSE